MKKQSSELIESFKAFLELQQLLIRFLMFEITETSVLDTSK